MSPSHWSSSPAKYLSPGMAGGVRLPGCLQSICFHVYLANHLSPSLPGCVWLAGCLQFMCRPWPSPNSFVSPYSKFFVSQFGGRCLALWMFSSHLSSSPASHLSPSLAGGIRFSGMNSNHFSPSLTPSFSLALIPTLSLTVRFPSFVSFGRVLGIGTLSPSGLPVVSNTFQLFPIVFKVPSNGRPSGFHFSPSCLRVVVQI